MADIGRHGTPRSSYNFVVRDDEAALIEWIEGQYDFSSSMRCLIKKAVRYNGICDVSEPGREVRIDSKRR